jgi:hypothetical protein
MRRELGLALALVTILTFCTSHGSSTLIPLLDLFSLCDSADIIVVGHVQSVRMTKSTSIDLAGNYVPANVMSGEIVVDKVLKGDPLGNRLPFHFVLPVSPAGGMGYAGVPSNSYRLVFLKRSDEDYDIASPYYPSFPAVPVPSVNGDDVADRVIAELAAVIESNNIPAQERVKLLFELQQVDTPIFRKALKNALGSDDRTVRLSAAGALLERNDLAGLEVGKQALLNPPPNVPVYIVRNLSSSISRGVTDTRAIPGLGQILRSAPDAESRRAAAAALRKTGSASAKNFLLAALDDRDLEVRYYAVIGLAEITGQSEWRPLMDEYKSNEQRYLLHWQDWGRKEQ